MVYVFLFLLGISAVEATEKHPLSQENLPITWPVGKKIVKKQKPLHHRAEYYLQVYPPLIQEVHNRRHAALYYDAVKEDYEKWIAEKMASWEKENDESVTLAQRNIQKTLRQAQKNLIPASYNNAIAPLTDYEELKAWHYMISMCSQFKMPDKEHYLVMFKDRLDEFKGEYGLDFFEHLMHDIKMLPKVDKPDESGRIRDLTLEELEGIREKFAHLRGENKGK